MTNPLNGAMDQRVQRLLAEQQQQHYATIDRMFGVLMLIQWLAAVAAAYWFSPLAWEGLSNRTHPHVWLSLGVGGAITSLPVLLDFFRPGRRVTRYVNSAAQVMFSALLIHVTGGRIETHFHVFGSLAFLACYRDWKVLVPATLIVAVDHFVRGFWWPESVFGVASASQWRWLEHAGWVIFEDIFLTLACLKGVSEMRNVAARAVALEETDRWKKSILDAALEAVVSMDRHGRITEWNGEAETVFGWRASEAIGQPMHELIIPNNFREPHRNGLRQYLETGVGPVLNQRIEVTALRRDGTEFPIELAITPIHAQHQVTFCGFIRDISSRKIAEQELLRAKEAAEAANHAKSSFLANMSHEIRTPLNGILGFAELLRRGSDHGDEGMRLEFIETIERSGRHLLTVINDVLDLSKIEAGQLEIQRITCSPHEMLADVVSILRVTAQEKGLTLNYFWDGDVPKSIETDPDRLRQILMNLVGNAIKFTEHGSITITAKLQRSTDDQAELRFLIKDTGVGIPANKLEVIFEPFMQGDSSVTRRYGGTGLGLSICKCLCQLLGGAIEVQSQPGLGSLFTFTINAGHTTFGLTKSPMNGDLIESAHIVDQPSAEMLHERRILLIEDGEINRKFIQTVLLEAGAEVTLAENGKQGLEKAVRQPFSAILLDMQMPVMDGYKAAAEMRRSGIACPIIALTAHAMSGDADKCLKAGCSHYLSKPIQSDRLLHTLVEILGEAEITECLEPYSTKPGQKVSNIDVIRSTLLPTDKPGYRRLVHDYVQSLPKMLEALETACRDEDLESLHQITHRLKGSGGMIGFPALTDAADHFAEIIRRQETEQVPQQFERLRNVIHRVIAGHAG